QANPYNLYVAAVDKVGNVKYTSRSFFIDQDLDIPGSCVNIPTAADITFPGSTANGEATDDDGLARLHYYIGTAATPTPAEPNAVTGWGATTGDGSNDIYGTITIDGTPKSYPWSIKTPTGQGEYHIYLWSVDEHNVMQATPTKRTYSQFASRMPTVNIIGLSASDTYGGEVDLTFDAYGGANFNVTEIEYRIYSTHNYDLTWKVIDVADAKIVSEGLTFDTSLYTDADCHTITIEVKCTNDDGSGATSNVATFSVKADNTPPNIEITNPNSGSKLNGLATIMGTSTDDWSGVKAIYIGYFADMTNALMDSDYSTEADLSADTRAVPTLGKWIKISPTAAWSYQFNTTVIGNDSSYPLYVAAVDNKGNVKYTSRTFDVDQDSDRPTINILAPLDGSTVTPQSAVTGNAIDDDGVRYIYVYIVKSGHATYDNPPDDYTTWGNTHNNDVSGCIIDLSSKNSPINYSWTAITPNNSATYKVYAFAADKNTPTDYNSSPRLYSQRSSTYYVSSAYDVIEIIQKTTESPIAEITNSVSDIYSGVGNYTVNFKFTGGAGENVLKYYYDISSDIKRFPVAAGTFEEVAIGTPSNIVSGSFVFDASGYFNSSVRNLAIKVKCSDETHGDSNIATYYLRADSRNPSLSITEPLDNTKIDTWLASGGWLRGSITDDVVVDRVTIRWVEGGVTWSSSASEITLSAGSTTKTFEKQFTLGLLGNTYLEKNFVITAYDSMNNSTTASLKIAKENTPPDVPVLTTPSGTPLLLGDGPGLTISGTVHDNIEVTDVTIDLVGTAWSWKATLGAGTTDKTWTKTFTNIQTQLGGYGDKTFKVTAYDNQGNSSYLIFTLMGDSTKPVVTVKSHANNASYGNNASFDLTGDATDNIKVTGVSIKWVEGNKTWTDATVTGGDKSKVWKKTFNFVKDGANGLFLTPMADTEQYADKTFEITVKDDQDNESTTSIRLTGDNAAPVITITNAEGSNIGTGANFTLSGNVTDNREVVRVTVKADGIATVWDSAAAGVTLGGGTTSRTWSRTFDILSDLGSYASRSFEVTAYDKKGNSSVSRVNLKGDLTAPTIKSTLTAPADMKLGTGSTFTITGEVTDDIEPTKVEIRLGGVLKATLTGGSGLTESVVGVKTKKNWTKTFNILTDLTDYSDKTFEVTAYDAQGNTSVKIFNIMGDRVKPSISNVNPANNGSIGTAATLTMTGKITDDVLIKYLSIKNIETGTVWDETLNSGTWTSNKGIGFTQVTANRDYNWSKTFNILADLANYGDKTFEITAKDSQNNEYVSTIRLTGDKTPPTIKSTLDAPAGYKIGTGTSFTITGEVTDDIEPKSVVIKYNGSTLHTLTDGSGLTNNPDTKKKIWSATVTIAQLGGTYSDKTLEIIASDAQGNQSTKSFNLLGDRTAPFISGTLSSPATGNIGTGTSFTITGEVTDDIEPTKVEIKYNGSTLHTLTGGPGLTNNPNIKKKRWSAAITIASIGGTYSDKTFEIVAYDAQNNSSAKTFTLLGDRTAPTIGATLIAPALSGGVYPLGDGPSFTITGSVMDDISPTKVEIKYNNSVIWTCQDVGSGLTDSPDVKNRQWSKTFADISATFGDYNNKMIEIVAYDAQGNSSVKVFSIIGDTTKPSVAITSHTDNAALPASFTLSGTCSDNIGVTRIVVEHEGGTTWDSAIPAHGVTLTAGTSWSKSLAIAALGGTYTDKAFTVYAYDAQGNVNSDRVTFIGDRVAPTVGIASHSNGAFVKSTGAGFTLSGTATDKRQDTSINGVVTKVMVKTGAQDHTADFTAPNWSIASSKFTLTEASYTFEISAHDDLGNIKTERVYVTVDNSPPAVVFSSPADNAALNGTVVVNGTVSDNSSGVKALYISYFASAPTLSNYDEESELEAHSTTNISEITTDWAGKNLFKITGFTASWSHNYDTTKIFNDQSEHPNTIYLFAVDNNGNVTTSTSTPNLKSKAVKINQSLDKPTAKILVPVNDNDAIPPSSAVSGSASDDDGLKYVYIFIGNTTAYPTPPANLSDWIMTGTDASGCRIDLSATNPLSYNWTVTTPSAEGAYKLWVATVDKNVPTGTEGVIVSRPFSQTTSTKPLIYNHTPSNTTYSGPLTINLSASGGGKNVTRINYRISGTSDSGWQYLEGVAGAPGVNQFTISSSVNTSLTFDTASYTSETTTDILVEVQAVNQQNIASDISSVYYRADNTKPDVTISSPIAGTTINGVQTVSGTANDWSTVEAIYFGYFRTAAEPDMTNDYATRAQLNAGSVTSPADPTTDKWFKVSSPSLNWNYSFDTTVVYNDMLNHPNYKFYVAALDKSGNVNYTTMSYIINQDMDMPVATISNPSYVGVDNPTSKNGNMLIIPKTFVMTGTVRDQDLDGVHNVYINIDLMKPNGDLSEDLDLTALNGSVKYTDGKWTIPELADYYEASPFSPMIIGNQEISWTYKITEFPESIGEGFYKLSVIPLDVNGKLGSEVRSYFVISNLGPQIEIISPDIKDPDNTSAYFDMYGTVISNVKDDMYWDNDPSNNFIYYDDDSTRNKWGWDSDLSENKFNIFNSEESDSTRSNYYRMIFRAKDDERINIVKISLDGGRSYIGKFEWSGGVGNPSGSFTRTFDAGGKIVDMDVMKRKVLKGNYFDYTYENMDTTNDATSDWVYFFVDIDTTKIDANTIIKVLAIDNDIDMPHETVASVQVNVDNSAPTGRILNWGIDSLTEKYEFSKTSKPGLAAHQYIAGDLSDVGSAGVRYANLYFWNNMQTDLDAKPNYKENGSGLITVNDPTNVPSGVHKVSIPENLGSVLVKNGVGDIGDVNPASSVSDNYPNSWIRAYKYLSSGWRVRYIYTNDESPSDADGNPGTYYGISTKYGDVYPSDGKKLICLEVVDNAGNKARKFYEHTFSEYPPTVTDANISWGSLPEEPVTDETPAGRKWIGNSFSMNGVVEDFAAGINRGIERIRVYIMKDDGNPNFTQKIYTSKTSDTVADPMYNDKEPVKVINTAPDISVSPTGTEAPVAWGFNLPQTIDLSDGNYMIMVEVRDKTGSTARKRQYVYLDKSAPTLVVNQPVNNQVVKGDLFVISGTASDVAGGGFNAGCVNIKILDATSDALKREWNTSLDSSNNWTQNWSLISDASDDFDISESRKVRVTLTDKAGNTHTLPDITVTKGPPPSWDVFEANGSSTSFNNATFKSKYTTIGASDPLFMIRGATSTFETQIQDSIEFTGAELKVAGYRQSDGAYLSSATPGFETLLATKTLNPNTGGVVGGNVTYTYAGLPDGEYEYKVELHQEAALINMRRYFIVDNTKPNIWVKKIENTDFNGYGMSTLNGHIDASHDNWGAGYTTGADAVSGVIYLQVKVKDNYLLRRIRVSMTDYNFGSGNGANHTLLQRNNTSGNWEASASRGALGDLSYFAVKDVVQSLGTDYDYVVFTLEFNTANLSGVAGKGKTLQFTAEDWVGNSTNEAGTNKGMEKSSFDNITSSSSMSSANAKPVAFTLDVVPYISGLTTGLDSGTLSFIKRSSTGKYPIKYSNLATDLLRINGYNLGNASAPTVAIGTVSPTIQTRDSAKYTWVDVRKNAAKSGLLSVSTGGVVSTNNINDNDRQTNKEAAIYFPDRNDDRYVAIWQIATSSYAGKTDAVMKPNSGRTDMDWMYVTNGQNVHLNGTVLSNSWTLSGGDFTYNSSGTFNYIFLHNMNWSSGSDNYQVHGSVQWGKDIVNEGHAVNWHIANTDRLGLGNLSFVNDGEYSYNDKVMDRYKNLQIINSGNNTDTNVYVAYFDKSSVSRSIVFWSFKVGTGVTNTTALASGWRATIEKVTDGNTGSYYSPTSNLNTGLKTPYVAGGPRRIEVTAVASGKDSEHFDMKHHSNRIYLTYYDETSMALKFKYCSSPVTAPQTWSSDVTVDIAAGLYVKTVVDPSGGIHMAYYDNSYSQLKYAYLTSYADTSADVYTVDALFTTGMYNAINIRDFDTSAGTDYRPIISTYSISYAGTKYSARVAYPTTNLSGLGNGADPSTNEYTGKWEVITVCSANAPGQSSTFIETDATTNYNGQILVGYNGAYIEEATLLSE
ncbi:MAG TPA: hypothetical protein PLO40_12385, partial [Spirochaetota bacterium]|nr:hypothetical protein [Spirochaetota bacterium]